MKLLHSILVTLFFGIGIYGNYFNSTTELIEKVNSESDAEAICFIGVDWEFLTVFLKTHPNYPVVIFEPYSADITWNSNTKLYGNVLLVVGAGVSEDPNDIEVLNQLILQLVVRNFAVIIAKDIESLQKYFLFFWEKKFRRTFGIVNETSYAYFQYADSKVLKLTETSTLPNALKDLNGHIIRTVIRTDLPRSFWFLDKKGTQQVGGFIARVFTTFVEKHNATFKDVTTMAKFGKGEISEGLLNNDLDVAMSPFYIALPNQLSYPVKFSKWTIVVPLRGYLDPNEYFLRPFSLTVWMCIGITCMYIAIMNILMNVLTGMQANVWHSFAQIYLTMLNMSLDQQNRTAYRFQLIQKIFAFIIVNIYLVSLTTFLTVFIKVKEYDSIEDLLEDDFPVILERFDFNYCNPEAFPEGFEKILILVGTDEIVKARSSMQNTSFAYGMGIDSFNFLQSVISKYSKPKFKTINKILHQAFFGFNWAKHAPLHAILSDFILRISDYGLIIKWTQDSVLQGSQIVKKDLNLQPELFKGPSALTFNQLFFAWNCLLIGLIAAFLVFLGEKFFMPWWKSSRRIKLTHTHSV